jgi:uncharacterized surface protein with fasciclin (FAS1) repeats
MRTIIRGATAALLLLAVAAAPVLAGSAGARPGSSTIVEIVVAEDREFDVLQAAVVEAGLVGALNGTRQYTVFAPTDQAFVTTFRTVLGDASLTEADVIAFIDAGGVDTALGSGALSEILLYHVTNGRRTSTSVVAAPRYQMLNDETLTRGELLAAGILTTDISASNGVVHVVNAVLLP